MFLKYKYIYIYTFNQLFSERMIPNHDVDVDPCKVLMGWNEVPNK